MPPKNRTSTTPSQPAPAQPSASNLTLKPTAAPAKPASQWDAQDIVAQIWGNYVKTTPQRTKLLDCFLGFLAVVGALQFVYVVLVGNYPFNAFLSGFSACVGQFVLTASLRIQTNPENKREFKSISNERAFADFVLGSLILHFFCVNFIN